MLTLSLQIARDVKVGGFSVTRAVLAAPREVQIGEVRYERTTEKPLPRESVETETLLLAVIRAKGVNVDPIVLEMDEKGDMIHIYAPKPS